MANQPKKYKKFVATAATATLVASAIVPVASAKSFSDVPASSEFQPFIDALSDAGIINGYQDGTFKPGAKLTRGQVVKMLGRWVESNGTAVPTDWETVQRFNDVPVNSADKELVKYAALVKDAGVFSGSNNNLMAGNNITRQQMAKVLNGAYEAVNGVSLVDLAESIDDKLINDLASSQSEFEGYIQALVDLEISTVSVFRPSENVTRAQFAKFLYNTINLEAVGSASVTAINNTTVEVAFPDAIDDIKDLDFKIEGLEVKNAVVKQTANNVAVLTTTAQKDGETYTVTVDGVEVGSFKGIGAVIPTSIKLETTSVQSKVGQQVTLKATTTPGAAVTFNVQATGNSLNENKKVEVYAGTDGVATYTYTQYGVAGVDNVTVYPTGAPNLLGFAKVYWGKEQILSVDTEEKTVDNGANRTYTVKYLDPTTGLPVQNATLNVTFKENLNDIDSSKTNDTTASIRKDNGSYVTPYQDTTATAGTNREEAFQVKTNSVGEATFVVTGKNTTATPVVYADANSNGRFEATELQATAGSSKFQGVQSPYTITWDKTSDFVAALSYEHGQNNPVAYKLTVNTDKKDKDGNPIPYVGATIKVAIQENQDSTLTNNTPAAIATSSNGSYTSTGVVEVTTNAKGEATVYLRSTVDNSKATPVAWIDLNAAGQVGYVGNNKLEEGEPFGVASTVTFLKSVVVAPSYSLNTPTEGPFLNGDTMSWKASLLNQSNQASETAGIKSATYTITNTSNAVQTIYPTLVGYRDLTITYAGATQTQNFNNGGAVTLEPGTTVTLHGIANGYVKATSTVAEYSNTVDATLNIVAPAKNGKLSVSGSVTTVRKSPNGDVRNDNNTYYYDAKEAEFIVSTEVPSGQVVTGEVIGYELTDSKFGTTANHGRVVIKEALTGLTKHYYYGVNDKYSAALYQDFNNQTTDNVLANANAFENLLSLGDKVQVNATAGGQNGSVRLYNADGSNKNQAVNNGYVITPVLRTAGVKAENAKYESAVVSTTNFSDSTFEIAVQPAGTTLTSANTATVTINGTDNAQEIANKIITALAAVGTTASTATVVVENDRVVIKATTNTTEITVQNSAVPNLFNNITKKPTTAVAGVRDYTLGTHITDITVGQTVTVNGIDYTAVTAGTTATATNFVADGALSTDLANLTAKITTNDVNVNATPSTSTITLTEKAGKEGTVTFTNITIK